MRRNASRPLAGLAGVLAPPSRAALLRLARLLESDLARMERSSDRRWRARGLEPAVRRALGPVTPVAAAAVLAGGRPLSEYLEQVDYHGRRLAKLEVPPARVAAEIAWVGRQMGQRLRRVAPAEAAGLEAARRQLELAALLVLNHAYYRVREAEAEAFHELFCAELEARNHRELVERCLDTLARWSRAAAAALYLRDGQGAVWRQAGCRPASHAAREITLPRDVERRLVRPRQILGLREGGDLVLDARWRKAFSTCWSVPLREGRRLAGVLQLGFRKPYEWLPRELRVLKVAAERILAASEKARLAEELEAREEQIRTLAMQMVHVEEAERQRISQELHDEAGQSLLCLRLRLEMLEQQTAAGDGLRRGLLEARRMVERSIEEIRRLVADLSPAVLEHLGLEAALRRLVSRFQRDYGIRVRTQFRMARQAPRRLQRVLYRLVQECLTNAGRHSRARRLNLSLESDDKRVRLRVEDDGVGFRVSETLADSRGFGLRGIRDRVELLGGRLELRSAPGRGTTVMIELPTPEAAAASPPEPRRDPRQEAGRR